jgi:hypothetical protein
LDLKFLESTSVLLLQVSKISGTDICLIKYSGGCPPHVMGIGPVYVVLPQLGSAGFGFVFAGFAGGSATLVNQANYF